MMHALLALPAITSDQVFTIDQYWLTLVLGAVIPFLADALTQQFTTGWPKAAALLGLSAAAAVVQDVQASGGRFTVTQLLTSFLLALATAFTTHNTIWKPIKLTGDNGVVQRVTGGFGIPGPRKPPELVGPAGAAYVPGTVENRPDDGGPGAQLASGYAQGGPVLPAAAARRLAGPPERILSPEEVRRYGPAAQEALQQEAQRRAASRSEDGRDHG